jgi:hypothetical protein
MAETQREGVQMKALRRRGIRGLISINSIAIDRIANDRVSDLRQMAS